MCALLDVRLSTKTCRLANPPDKSRCYGERFFREVSDFTLPRKASIQENGARTANRHR
jgi:hypothetical protein